MPESMPNMDVITDVIADVADQVRGIVHGALGTRPHRVFVVTRTWSSEVAGRGSSSDTEMELLPSPEVVYAGLRAQLRGAGREEEGDIIVKGISLRYSEEELYPRDRGANVEFAYRVDEAHGTERRSRWYVADQPPVARRGDQSGDDQDWVISLKRAQDFGAGDGV